MKTSSGPFGLFVALPSLALLASLGCEDSPFIPSCRLELDSLSDGENQVPYNDSFVFQDPISALIPDETDAALVSAELAPGSGPLPPGLAIVGSSVVGTPQETGTFRFTIIARGECDSALSPTTVAEGNYVVTIKPCPALLIEMERNPPTAELNEPYAFLFRGSGGRGKRGFRLQGGVLPAGMAIAADGFLEGRPTETGEFSFSIEIFDECSPPQTESRFATLSVVPFLPCSPLSFDRANQPSIGRIGEAFTFTPTTNGGEGSLAFSLASGSSPLPAGLVIDPATNSITGTPTEAGTSVVALLAMDDCPEGPQTAEGTFTFTIDSGDPGTACDPFDLGKAPVPVTGTVGEPFFFLPNTLGGQGSISFEVGLGGDPLPNGILINNVDGFIEGTPTSPGIAMVLIRAADSCSSSQTDSEHFRFRVDTASTCTDVILDRSPPTVGVITVPYAYSPSVFEGGTGPFSFSIVQELSSVPPGLSFDGTTLSGTPTAAGTFDVYFEVSDSCGDGGRTDGDYIPIQINLP